MAEKFSLSMAESLKKLSKSLENIEPSVEEELNSAIQDIAYATHAAIVAKAQAELNRTRQDYLKGLEFIELGDNSFVISLKGEWASMLEDGFPSYDQTTKLLGSKKVVQVGSRAGQPWVQEAQSDGHKFARVPMEKQPFSKAAGASELADSIKKMTAVNMQGRKQKITSIFKDLEGNPLQGKVATGRSKNPMLDQLVKYQKTYTNAGSGKTTTQSVYVNYRTISEIGDAWIHPGYKGLHAFADAEKYVEEQLDKIIKDLLGG